MSRVTGFVLHTSVCEDDGLEDKLNAFLQALDNCWRVKDTSDCGGGSKHPQCRVFVGGFNGFGLSDYQALLSWLASYPWEHPQEAVAIFSYEESDLGPEDTALIWKMG
jgi:hypothetical protein